MTPMSVLSLAIALSAWPLAAEDLTLDQAKAKFAAADKALNQAYRVS